MTTGKTELEGLLERVKAATRPDRELDVLICVALGGYVLERRGRDQKPWLYPTDREWFFRRAAHESPRYTASLDAALGLVERCLPNTSAAVKRWASGRGDAEIGGAGVADIARARAATPPLAILAALLAALIAQPNTPADRQGQVPEGDSDVG